MGKTLIVLNYFEDAEKADPLNDFARLKEHKYSNMIVISPLSISYKDEILDLLRAHQTIC